MLVLASRKIRSSLNLPALSISMYLEIRSADEFILDLRCVLNSMTGILIGRKDTQRQRKGPVMKEAEMGGMQLQTKERQGLLGATRSLDRGMEQIFPQSLNGTSPADTLVSGILNYVRINFYCFKIPSLW